jgi:hypothetical protein
MNIHTLPLSPAVQRAYDRLIAVVKAELDGTSKKKVLETHYLKRSFHKSGTRARRPNG